MTMTLLRRTPGLHRMLQSVADGHVVHHSGTCGAWPTGWSWSTGGHMADPAQEDAETLRHARLVAYSHPSNPCGNPALLTFEGSARLVEWNLRFPADGAA